LATVKGIDGISIRQRCIMISEKNTLIGHIIEINGADFTAQIISDEEGFVSEVTVYPPAHPRSSS